MDKETKYWLWFLAKLGGLIAVIYISWAIGYQVGLESRGKVQGQPTMYAK